MLIFLPPVDLAKSRDNSGWTSLHLASCFGHKDVVVELLKVRVALALFCTKHTLYLLYGTQLQAGADVNLQNDMGDTPLHKAASAGRKVN